MERYLLLLYGCLASGVDSMRNIDKFYEDLVLEACDWDVQMCVGCNVYELRTGRIAEEECCHECKKCHLDGLEWLKQEYKEPLSEVERIILENVKKEYQWIVRDKHGELCIHKQKPVKDEFFKCWFGNDFINFDMFSHLFKMVQWEDKEPKLITELLKRR